MITLFVSVPTQLITLALEKKLLRLPLYSVLPTETRLYSLEDGLRKGRTMTGVYTHTNVSSKKLRDKVRSPTIFFTLVNQCLPLECRTLRIVGSLRVPLMGRC